MNIKQIDWNICSDRITQIYRNLNQKGYMSLRQQIDRSWLVVGHDRDLILKDVTFSVSQASRQRVIASGRKNVHAYATATLINSRNFDTLPPLTEIFYCPFTQTYFSWKDTGERIERADYLAVIDTRVYCSVDVSRPQLSLF